MKFYVDTMNRFLIQQNQQKNSLLKKSLKTSSLPKKNKQNVDGKQ